MKKNNARFLIFSGVSFILLTIYDVLKTTNFEYLNYYIAICIGGIITYALMILDE